MRKIDHQTQTAFWSGTNMSKSNTDVVTSHVQPRQTELYLHNNKIAELVDDRWLSMSNAGYYTNVTKNRLNAVLGNLNQTGIFGGVWHFVFKGDSYPWPLDYKAKIIIDLKTKVVTYDKQWYSERINIRQAS
jgi:hypothetical protein